MNRPFILHQFLSYLKFLLKSTNEHGVHSPFVYELVTKCFYDKKSYPPYQILQNYRKSLLNNEKKIKITDFGAGSRIFTSDERKVSDIAKNAGITPKRAKLLNRLVKYFETKNALELGTSVGLGTTAIAAGNKLQVTTIEGCPATAAIAKKQFENFKFQNINLKVAEFDEVLDPKKNEKREERKEERTTNSKQNPQPTTENPQPITDNSQPTTAPPTLIFIDGNHQKEATLKYFERLLAIAHNDSVFIFDDIHWSAGMEKAWEEIKNHPAVTVTIDIYFWGFVFFRREQEKEHFVIRL